MNYEVLLNDEAEQELAEAYDWLAQRTANAPEWYNKLLEAVLSHKEYPERCPIQPRASTTEPIRQLLYGDKQNGYRILFTI